MSEEIKEILDRLDFNEWEVDLYKVPITWTELYDVRDYITNLQKKVEQLENIRKEAIEELTYMSTDAYVEDYDIREKHYNLLMNILNKGENNE